MVGRAAAQSRGVQGGQQERRESQVVFGHLITPSVLQSLYSERANQKYIKAPCSFCSRSWFNASHFFRVYSFIHQNLDEQLTVWCAQAPDGHSCGTEQTGSLRFYRCKGGTGVQIMLVQRSV